MFCGKASETSGSVNALPAVFRVCSCCFLDPSQYLTKAGPPNDAYVCMQAFMLRRIESGPVAKVARAVAEVLASCEAKGVISSMQRHSLTAEIAGKLQNVL